jgi:hypothetical protein
MDAGGQEDDRQVWNVQSIGVGHRVAVQVDFQGAAANNGDGFGFVT